MQKNWNKKVFKFIGISLYFIFNIQLAYSSSFMIDEDFGREFIEKARASAGLESTTFCRSELKSVINHKLFSSMVKNLRGQGVELEKREKREFGHTTSTFTIYSFAAVFYQGQVKTSIRLRTRFYVDIEQMHAVKKDEVLNQKIVDDAIFSQLKDSTAFFGKKIRNNKTTKSLGFLEIKIKSPTILEENKVIKLRMKVGRELLKELYRTPPDSEEFETILDEIANDNIELNNSRHVNSIVSFIRAFAQNNSGFVTPLFGVSYDRSAYSYTQRKRQDQQGVANSTFQITIDKNIKYHKIDLASDFINPRKYFKGEKSVIGTYPDDALAVEFKDPIAANEIGMKRTLSHQELHDNFVVLAQSEPHVYAGFSPNKGKAAHFVKIVDFKDRFTDTSWGE